ncbi:hypothetical protein RBSWK_01734 [Rhodopirellula baltica SWK14]|uniref:Uncharacterized protein n=1 Tax=Rhodopirellula baltica SWK14 TaxID=993516 RepID=L7CKH0_RHOBT|nr:hypothetical protein RBSWK_01734 [Rhodopirellula baltica SWK14]
MLIIRAWLFLWAQWVSQRLQSMPAHPTRDQSAAVQIGLSRSAGMIG